MTLKLGSLFSGAGGFEFAAQICGIEPVWASEIEPFPIAVTSKRFPNMKHLGDVTKIKGGEIEPVDIITFGSPCTDMSCAGKREGLKHSDLGDKETTRSGLFMEAIRIIKEMRDATNGMYPRVAIFENVVGAYSSSKGEDFRTILQSFINIIDKDAVIPRPPKGKWSYAGEIVGDGYSFAWRTLDAQYWGVPQRRRRIFAVADFRGGGAGKVLFERNGLSRSFAAQRESWKGFTRPLAFRSAPKGRVVKVYDARGNGGGAICPTCTGDHESRITDYTAVVVGAFCYKQAPSAGGIGYDEAASPVSAALYASTPMTTAGAAPVRSVGDAASCLGTNCGMSTGRNAVFCIRERCGCDGGGKGLLIQDDKSGTIATSNDQFLCVATQQGGAEIAENLCPTITSAAGTSGNNQPYIVALDRAAYNQGENAQFAPGISEDGVAHTVLAKGPGAVCYAVDCRNGTLSEINGTLQAKPNGGISYNTNIVTLHLTPVEIILRRLTPTECARLQGMPDWWCDDVPHSDSAEYKMWGNGMALPCVLYVMEGVKELLEQEEHDAETSS